MAQVRCPLQRSEVFAQTNNLAISNRKSFCARQWVLCVRCPGSIEAVWSICPCIDQEETLLAEVHPWRQHHPGLHGQVVGFSNAKKGVLNGVPFHLYAMKEPDYTMLIMSTYGTNATVGEEKKRHYNKDGQKKVTTFVYPEVVHNHYCYRNVIDNHNSVRMHPISMEETWMITRWPNHGFCFLLTVTIVNVQNAG